MFCDSQCKCQGRDICGLGVFKDDHIKEMGGELALKNRKVGRIWIIGGKGVRD